MKTDSNGRTVSRELLLEVIYSNPFVENNRQWLFFEQRVVEENTTTRIESWPPTEKKVRRSTAKTTRPVETVPKKPATKENPVKRRTKSLSVSSSV